MSLQDKNIYRLILLKFLFLFSFRILYSQISNLKVSYNITGYQNLIEGSTGQVIINEGVYNQQNIDISYKVRFSSQLVAGFQIGGYYTDDRFMSSTRFDFRRFNFNMNLGIGFFQYGTLCADFSPYVLEGAFKGVRMDSEIKNAIFTPIYGLFKPKRENVNNDWWVYGARYKQKMAGNHYYTISFANIYEGKKVYTNVEQFNNSSANVEFLFNLSENVVWKGNWASSSYLVKGSSITLDDAYQTSLLCKIKEHNLKIDYEKVGSSFVALGGWVFSDTERLDFNVDRNLGKNIFIRGYLNFFHDNVNKWKEDTIFVNEPGADVFYSYDRGEVRLGYSKRSRENDLKPKTLRKQQEIQKINIHFTENKFDLHIDFNRIFDKDIIKSINDINSLFFKGQVKYKFALDIKHKNILAPLVEMFQNTDIYVRSGLVKLQKSYTFGADFSVEDVINILFKTSFNRLEVSTVLVNEKRSYNVKLEYSILKYYRMALAGTVDDFVDFKNPENNCKETVISTFFSVLF